FGAELVAAIERLVDERIARAIEQLESPGWLTLEQAAARCHTTPGALRKRAQRGQLPGAVRDGARWLVDRRALDNALQRGTIRTDHENGRAPRERSRPGTGGISSHAR